MAKVCLERSKFSHIRKLFFEFVGKFIYNNRDIYEGAFRDGYKCGKGQGISECVILIIKKILN